MSLTRAREQVAEVVSNAVLSECVCGFVRCGNGHGTCTGETFADQQTALDKFSVNALCKVRRTCFCSAFCPEAPNVLSEAILDLSISIKNL